jgi:hypothetical protein
LHSAAHRHAGRPLIAGRWSSCRGRPVRWRWLAELGDGRRPGGAGSRGGRAAAAFGWAVAALTLAVYAAALARRRRQA